MTRKMGFFTSREIPRITIKTTYEFYVILPPVESHFISSHRLILLLLLLVKFISLLGIERELFAILPHTRAMFYYGLVECYRKSKRTSTTMFRDDHVTILKEEPTPCK